MAKARHHAAGEAAFEPEFAFREGHKRAHR